MMGVDAVVQLGGASTTWDALYAARDRAGFDAWYPAHTGATLTPTATFTGDQYVDAGWLTGMADGVHVHQEAGRWVVERVHASQFRVVADNITFRQCVVEPGGGYHGITSPVGENPSGIIIEDCTLNGQGADWLGVQFPEATEPDQVIVRRCNITSFRVGIQIMGGLTAEYNWVHDLFYSGVDAHDTSMSIRSRNVTVRRNRLADGNSAALAFYNENSPYTNILAQENIISTPQAIWEVAYLGSYPPGSNTVRLVGNLFDRGALAYADGNFTEVSGNYTFAGTPVT